MPQVDGQKVRYHRLLRALGAWLDGEAPYRFSVIETPDGFTVVLEAEGDHPERRDVFLSHAELAQSEAALAAHRRPVQDPPLADVYEGDWRLVDTSHQDVLRALGYELDDAIANAVILDELWDGLLVTYSYVEASEGYSWHKRIVILKPEDIRKIMDVAVSRRRVPVPRTFWDNLRERLF